MMVPRRRGGNLGLLLLGSQVMNFGLQNIPPVTLGLLAGQVAIFLGLFPKQFPSPNAVCMSSYLVLQHKAYRRMLLANFFHADDMHLYFNMVSLLYKGSMLERKFGNVYFAYLVALFTGLTSVIYVGLGFVLDTVLQDQSYYLSCAVGFSGVLFALKVLTTHYSPNGMQYALGFIPVPSKYIFWVELILIQLITPNASFVGHLAGILVGLLYTKGPLKPLMDSFMQPGGVIDFTQPNRLGQRQQPSVFSSFFSSIFGQQNQYGPRGGQTSGYRTTNPPRYGASSTQRGQGGQDDGTSDRSHSDETDSSMYDHYTGGFSEDQQFQHALEESMRHQGAGPATSRHNSNGQRLYPELDDLRNRRSNYYQ